MPRTEYKCLVSSSGPAVFLGRCDGLHWANCRWQSGRQSVLARSLLLLYLIWCCHVLYALLQSDRLLLLCKGSCNRSLHMYLYPHVSSCPGHTPHTQAASHVWTGYLVSSYLGHIPCVAWVSCILIPRPYSMCGLGILYTHTHIHPPTCILCTAHIYVHV